MSREKNHVYGHIRYIFVFRVPSSKNIYIPKYYAVLLTDDNRVYFDKYVMSVPKKRAFREIGGIDKFFSQVTAKMDGLMEKAKKLFWLYEIDSKTEVVFAAYEKIEDSDLYYKIFKFIESFNHVYVSKTQLSFVCNRVARYAGKTYFKKNLDEMEISTKRMAIAVKFSKLYKMLLETGKCPWINSEADIQLHMFSEQETTNYMICLVGLWFMAVRQYYRMCNENYGHVVKKGMTFKDNEQ